MGFFEQNAAVFVVAVVAVVEGWGLLKRAAAAALARRREPGT
jgi:hypothetical protein